MPITLPEIKKLTEAVKGATKIEKWILTSRGEVFRGIINQDGGKSRQRLPKHFYKDLKKDEVLDLLDRLNDNDRHMKAALARYELKTAFIPEKLLSDFINHLKIQVNEKRANEIYRFLCHYSLEFFATKSPNPNIWYSDYQTEWGKWLVEELKLSPSTIKQVKNSLNRFMSFWASKTPDQPLLIFTPAGRSKLKEIKIQRELEGKGIRYYIPDDDIKTILNKAPEYMIPYIQLAYHYGLRRGELLALTTLKVRKGYLLIDRQIKDDDSSSLPKHGKTRKVDHWFCSATDAHSWISSLKRIKADALSGGFTDVVESLLSINKIKNKYVLHDCRHTWCSNAVKIKNINDVMRAAGHSDLRVTAGYLKDTRELDDEIFQPA